MVLVVLRYKKFSYMWPSNLSARYILVVLKFHSLVYFPCLRYTRNDTLCITDHTQIPCCDDISMWNYSNGIFLAKVLITHLIYMHNCWRTRLY